MRVAARATSDARCVRAHGVHACIYRYGDAVPFDAILLDPEILHSLKNSVLLTEQTCSKLESWMGVQVRHATVSDDRPAELNSIRALEPSTMNWSDICDYMHESTFHSLVYHCSLPTTKHLMYSMCWTNDTKGACVIDYGFPAGEVASRGKQKFPVAVNRPHPKAEKKQRRNSESKFCRTHSKL